MKAFSIIEFLLALLLLSIILLITLPFGQGLLARNRAEAYTDELRAALRFTRISAIKSGEKVTFCGSKNLKECDGSWEEGQIITTASKKVLRVLPKVFAGDKLVWRGSLNKNQIDFLPTGFLDGLKGSFHYYSSNNKENSLVVTLEATGRVRTSKEIT